MKNRTNIARKEIIAELENAIKNRVEAGSVVTSTGLWFKFTVRYGKYSGFRKYAAVHIVNNPLFRSDRYDRNNEQYQVKNAASLALWYAGYTYPNAKYD
jgi:hypothetical protein